MQLWERSSTPTGPARRAPTLSTARGTGESVLNVDGFAPTTTYELVWEKRQTCAQPPHHPYCTGAMTRDDPGATGGHPCHRRWIAAPRGRRRRLNKHATHLPQTHSCLA